MAWKPNTNERSSFTVTNMADLDDSPHIIEQPDSLTEALQSQVSFFKNANENLQYEIKTLISENGQITKQLDELLKHKYEYENRQSIQNIELKSLEELKHKLLLAEKEKESFASLWYTAQSTIKSLEEELQTYQNHQHIPSYRGDADQIKKEYSSALHLMDSKLKQALDEIDCKNNDLKKLEEDMSKLKKLVSEKEKSLNIYSNKQSELQIEKENLSLQLSSLRNELNNCKKTNEKLINDIEHCQNSAEAFSKKEMESRMKVAEALKIVDAVVIERDIAIENEKSTAEECKRLNSKVSEILNESSLRVQKEVEIARQSYNDKLNEMLIHIQRLELEMGEKNLFLERALRDCKILEDEIERRKKGNVSSDDSSKLLMLEQKLEATFQQLVISERRNIQIVSEKESLQMDMEQISNCIHRDRRKKEWEDKLHTNEIKSVRQQLNNVRSDLDNAHKTIQRLQSEISHNEELNNTLQRQRLSASKEFERHFETQQQLNQKWKHSMKEVTCKLEKRLEELKLENKKLKRDQSKFSETMSS